MGSRIGIIAGSGLSARQVVDEANRRGLNPAVAAVAGEALDGVEASAKSFLSLKPGDLGRLTAFFKDQGISEILMVGKADPGILLDPGAWDREARSLVQSVRGDMGPASVLAALIEYLARKGLRVIDPRPFFESSFCNPGILTSSAPAAEVLQDIEFGWSRARALADLDIGQTLVVKQGIVIAVEGLEGTDRTLERAGRLAGPGIVAVKVGRTRQDFRIDLPAVGRETVRVLAEARGAALCFEAKTVPFFEKVEALKLAEAAGLAVVAR